jgi:hypothetical protein
MGSPTTNPNQPFDLFQSGRSNYQVASVYGEFTSLNQLISAQQKQAPFHQHF